MAIAHQGELIKPRERIIQTGSEKNSFAKDKWRDTALRPPCTQLSLEIPIKRGEHEREKTD